MKETKIETTDAGNIKVSTISKTTENGVSTTIQTIRVFTPEEWEEVKYEYIEPEETDQIYTECAEWINSKPLDIQDAHRACLNFCNHLLEDYTEFFKCKGQEKQIKSMYKSLIRPTMVSFMAVRFRLLSNAPVIDFNIENITVSIPEDMTEELTEFVKYTLKVLDHVVEVSGKQKN